MKRLTAIILSLVLTATNESCISNSSYQDTQNTISAANKLASNQATPTDIDYSLERYNLIRRAYWVNGQREKANSLVCSIEKPLGYVVLFSDAGSIIGKFIVDGKVSSLNSYLSPDSEYYESSSYNEWVADIDGSYGENDAGIFFFDIQGNYVEWTGTYLYTDIPMSVDETAIKFEVNYGE